MKVAQRKRKKVMFQQFTNSCDQTTSAKLKVSFTFDAITTVDYVYSQTAKSFKVYSVVGSACKHRHLTHTHKTLDMGSFETLLCEASKPFQIF